LLLLLLLLLLLVLVFKIVLLVLVFTEVIWISFLAGEAPVIELSLACLTGVVTTVLLTGLVLFVRLNGTIVILLFSCLGFRTVVVVVVREEGGENEFSIWLRVGEEREEEFGGDLGRF
jgi:hypothetical protein